MSSWQTGTKKQYNTYLGKWLEFCREGEVNKYTRGQLQSSALDEFQIGTLTIGSFQSDNYTADGRLGR